MASFIVEGVGIGGAQVLAHQFAAAVVGVSLSAQQSLRPAPAASVVVHELLGDADDNGGVAARARQKLNS